MLIKIELFYKISFNLKIKNMQKPFKRKNLNYKKVGNTHPFVLKEILVTFHYCEFHYCEFHYCEFHYCEKYVRW